MDVRANVNGRANIERSRAMFDVRALMMQCLSKHYVVLPLDAACTVRAELDMYIRTCTGKRLLCLTKADHVTLSCLHVHC